MVGFPGIYEPDADRIMAAPNLPGWEEPGSVDALRAQLGPRFSIDNDVNLATVAELEHGAGAGAANFVFVSVGTGIGMGIVIGGDLYRGSSGRAGEISYLPVGDGPRTAARRPTSGSTGYLRRSPQPTACSRRPSGSA